MAAWRKDEDPSFYRFRDCESWYWWFRYPIDNLRRVWRNHRAVS